MPLRWGLQPQGRWRLPQLPDRLRSRSRAGYVPTLLSGVKVTIRNYLSVGSGVGRAICRGTVRGGVLIVGNFVQQRHRASTKEPFIVQLATGRGVASSPFEIPGDGRRRPRQPTEAMGRALAHFQLPMRARVSASSTSRCYSRRRGLLPSGVVVGNSAGERS